MPDTKLPDDLRDAYARGWKDACSLAIARFTAFTECYFDADEAIAELREMIETGAVYLESGK